MNPILAALISQAWAMDPGVLRAMLAEVELALSGKSDGVRAFFGADMMRQEPKLDVKNGVATIPIRGVMMKSIPPILKALGFGGMDIGDMRQLLVDAVFRDDVREIHLDIDSPGGDVAGTKELADEVYAARSLKPITARSSGTMASAAYWVGSQANRVTATPSTQVGNIGVFATLVDSSKAAEGAGIQVHVVGSNGMKGAGTSGAPVTGDQLEELRARVNKFGAMFNDDVARGRGIKPSEAAALATGALWIGNDAKGAGLVDDIEPSKVQQKETAMDIEKLKAELADTVAKLGAKSTEAIELAAKLEAALKRVTEIEAALNKMTDHVRGMLLAKYEDRYSPADLAAIKEYGEFCGQNLDKFEAHLKARQPVINPKRVSDPGKPDADPQAELPPAVLAVAKQMGNTVADIRKYGLAS